MTPPPIASTSATAIEPKPQHRIAVRQKRLPSLFSAYQLHARTVCTLGKQDRKIVGEPGDWVVTQANDILDVLPADVFRHQYEIADEGSLTISGKDRALIEQTLGIGSTLDSSRLVGSIVRLARLSIGEIAVDFTPGQWEELDHRAKKRGLTVENLVKQIVAKVTQDIWNV
jgi:hypothetical protein